MSNLLTIQPAAPGRRELIKALAFAVVATGGIIEDAEAAQHVHEEAVSKAKATGTYGPKEMSAAEFKTLGRLAELIVPADDVSGSALDAGAPAFIDLLCSQNKQLAAIYHGGLAWLDAEMNKTYSKSFVNATVAQQTAMLDLLVDADKSERVRMGESDVVKRSDFREFTDYTFKQVHPQAAGAKFFDWVRRMTVDAFYTSPIGMKDIGYMGNKAYSKYEVPKESLEYAMKHSPFA